MIKLKIISDEGIPYGTDVHLVAGVYDGLYRKKFIEGAQAQLEKIKRDIKVYLKSCPHTTDSSDNMAVRIPLSDWDELTA